jgi:hypothetical protein
MRDFEDVDGDCNESQRRWDDDGTDAWELDDIDDGESDPEDSE